MPNLVEKLYEDALSFMNKRLPLEKRTAEDIKRDLRKLIKDIESLFSNLQNVNVSSVSTIIRTQIVPLVNQFREIVEQIMEETISNNFEVGYNQAFRFIKMANLEIEPIKQDELYEETLAALLLLSKTYIQTLSDDISKQLEKDLTSIFIMSRRKSNPSFNDPEQDRNSDSNSLVATFLAGSIIAKYINLSFKNISNRADVIAKTETNRALNYGVMLGYLEAQRKYSNLKVKWVEVKDGKVCRYCKAAARGGDYGEGIYEIGSVNPPPIHARCRCILIPYNDIWLDIY